MKGVEMDPGEGFPCGGGPGGRGLFRGGDSRGDPREGGSGATVKGRMGIPEGGRRRGVPGRGHGVPREREGFPGGTPRGVFRGVVLVRGFGRDRGGRGPRVKKVEEESPVRPRGGREKKGGSGEGRVVPERGGVFPVGTPRGSAGWPR